MDKQMGQCIRFLRKERHLTKEVVAHQLQIPLLVYSKIETGEIIIQLSRIKQLAWIFDVHITELVNKLTVNYIKVIANKEFKVLTRKMKRLNFEIDRLQTIVVKLQMKL